MRILIVNDQHWPMRSGCAQASRTQALGLAARGHEVHVLAPSLNHRNDDDQDRNYTITRIRSFKFRNNLRISVTLDREIQRVLRDFMPDVVHVHTQLPLGLAALRGAVALDIPVVATNHVMPDNLVDNVKLFTPLSRPISYIWTEYGNLLYRGARRIVMPTASALDLFNLTRIEAPTLAISNGINLDQFQPIPAPKELYEKFSIPQDKHIIGYLGRLDNEKHIDTVVRAFVELAEVRDDVHMLLVGAGNAESSLRRLVQEFNIEDRVTFTGLASEEDWPILHRIPTVYTMPSPNELQSIATLEAMASGKPIVAVDAGALSELCHDEKNGFLVAVDDSDGFRDSIATILDAPELLEKFQAESVAIAKTHDENIVMPQFEALYEAVIEENRQLPRRPRRAFRSVLGGQRQG